MVGTYDCICSSAHICHKASNIPMNTDVWSADIGIKSFNHQSTTNECVYQGRVGGDFWMDHRTIIIHSPNPRHFRITEVTMPVSEKSLKNLKPLKKGDPANIERGRKGAAVREANRLKRKSIREDFDILLKLPLHWQKPRKNTTPFSKISPMHIW